MDRPPVCTPSRTGGRVRWASRAGLALALLALFGLTGSATTGRHATPLAGAAAQTLLHRSNVTPTASRVARAASTWSGGTLTASTGETVTVYVSTSLAPELGTPQTWADFIAGLVHGPELATLTAYIAPLEEIADICGPYALGCYGANQMASIGETEYGITAAEVVRHEYGHHIGWNRLNAPWQAVDWGPKHWASRAEICRRAAEGTAYPGDEGDRYELNPGEAWAETYRLLDERKAGASGSGWELVDPSFAPDELALQAAERDVLRPWTSSTRLAFAQRFTKKSRRVWTIPIATSLDGDLRIDVTLPKAGLHDVVLVDMATRVVVARGLWSSGSTKRIATTVCGARALRLEVRQRGAYGRVAVRVEKP